MLYDIHGDLRRKMRGKHEKNKTKIWKINIIASYLAVKGKIDVF
jgi:hypothetical protein